MPDCTHNCSTCSKSCGEKPSLLAPLNIHSKVRRVIAVMSGKGGVGKSLTSALLAVSAQRKGLKTAVLDADVTGPSQPRIFGIHEKAMGCDLGILPVQSKTGVRLMSINLLLENDADPVLWRGPVISGAVKQFWTDVYWDDIDLMIVDMPPGTGDVSLTVLQSIPVDGLIVVTSPQELVEMIVEKAVKMADMMHVPVLGLVENMSYAVCPDCGKQFHVFGENRADALAEKYHIPSLSRLPIQPKLAAACDKGMIELFEGDWLNDLTDQLTEGL